MKTFGQIVALPPNETDPFQHGFQTEAQQGQNKIKSMLSMSLASLKGSN